MNIAGIAPRSFVCGYCGNRVATDRGYTYNDGRRGTNWTIICICPNCGNASYFQENHQIPGVLFGESVGSLPPEVQVLYNEARECTGVGAYTAAAMAARKLLMNIAVNKGAQPGKSFAEYVDYLASKGYVSPEGKDWIDVIRTKGNEANHEIKVMTREDAEELIIFVQMLLKLIYEFPARLPKKGP